MTLIHTPKRHTPLILFPSLISKHSALFWCFPSLPRSVVPHTYPQGCIRELTADSSVPSTSPRPTVALPVCQGQVTFEPHGIIKAAPNCLCLCISLTYHGLAVTETFCLVQHTTLGCIWGRTGEKHKPVLISNYKQASIVSCAICFLGFYQSGVCMRSITRAERTAGESDQEAPS